jgi:antirestriction protein ArdC
MVELNALDIYRIGSLNHIRGSIMSLDIAQHITDRIIAELEKGATPWVKPWKTLRAMPGAGMPFNPISGTLYRGMNHFWLAMQPFEVPYYVTFKQAQSLGATVKAGEKGTPIVYWSINKKEGKDSNGDTVTSSYAFIKHYYVFNISQCEDLVLPAMPEPPAPSFDISSDVMAVVDRLELKGGLSHGGDSAYYRPSTDSISMPGLAAFNKPEHYHATLLHESVHATGAKHRLDRDFSKSRRFGDEHYAAEELVAELGAAMLCAHLGIDGDLRHAGYIGNWLKALRNDKKYILTASAQAQKALDFLTKTESVEETLAA